MGKVVALGALALSLAAAAAPTASARPGDCVPVRAVFYESSDWQRLAQGLGANPSPCADYVVTVPALAADKTQLVPGRAAAVRAQGPNFHACAEINYSAWQSWVSSTGNSWYSAGVEARRRMAAAGFDVSSGDTWCLNELSSAVRTNTGAARQNVRDLIRGLYEGDGTPVKGIVFAVGVGQSSVSFPTYKATMESWLQDQNFWADMTAYVGDFFQEAYGDVRNYAVAGADPATRAGFLNAFLQHPLALAEAPGAPITVAAARNFLAGAYGPLANASWAWRSSYGYTAVGSDVMADYISAETYAMRLAGEPRLGFAWNPLNSQGLSASDFAAQVGALLARLAGSIHETDGGIPSQACEATGCSAVVPGAAPVTGWSTFSTWTPTVAAFTSLPVNLPTATPSGPMTIQLQTGGVATTLPNPSTLTITSSSPGGSFSTSPAGPWSPSLTLTLPPWTGTTTFYMEDTDAGTPRVTANLDGQVTSQVETIAAPAPATTTAPPPPPPPATVTQVAFTPIAGRLHVGVRVTDGAGQPLEARLSLALLRGTSPFASTSGHTRPDGWFALTAFPRLERGCYRAVVRSLTASGHRWDGSSPARTYCVRFLPMHVAAIAFGRRNGHLRVGVRVVDDAGRVVLARVAVRIERHAATYASGAGRAASNGWFALTAAPRHARGCFRATVTSLAAAGYRWDGAGAAKTACLP